MPNASFAFDEMLEARTEPDVSVAFWSASDHVQLAYYPFCMPQARASLLMLHGGGAHSLLGYVSFAKTLRDTWGVNVYLMDLRGHGQSGGGRGDCPEPRTVWMDIRLAITKIRQEQHRPILLGGHSSGSGLLLNYASWARRARVEGYVMIAPELGYRAGVARIGRTPFATVHYGAFLWHSVTAGFLGGHAPAVFLNYPEAILQKNPSIVSRLTVHMANALTPQHPLHQFAQIREPLGLWIGENDELFDPDKVLALMDLPDRKHAVSQAYVVPHARHLSVLLKAGDDVGKWIHRLLDLQPVP